MGINNLIILCLLLGSCNVYSQSIGTAPFYIDETDSIGRKLDTYGFLEKAVPHPRTGDCKPTWDIFYFRVNLKGKIDSLYHPGGLREEVAKKIISNIYGTEGHWKVRKTNIKKEYCWFIFPYFDYGGTYFKDSDCDVVEKEKQKMLLEMAGNLITISHLIKGENSILLPVSEHGAAIIKK